MRIIRRRLLSGDAGPGIRRARTDARPCSSNEARCGPRGWPAGEGRRKRYRRSAAGAYEFAGDLRRADHTAGPVVAPSIGSAVLARAGPPVPPSPCRLARSRATDAIGCGAWCGARLGTLHRSIRTLLRALHRGAEEDGRSRLFGLRTAWSLAAAPSVPIDTTGSARLDRRPEKLPLTGPISGRVFGPMSGPGRKSARTRCPRCPSPWRGTACRDRQHR